MAFDGGLMRRASIAVLSGLMGEASDEAVSVATRVLAEDVSNRRWADQIGPCLSQRGVADLLGITQQAVAKRAEHGGLLRLPNGDGRPAYPLWQFDGRKVLAGMAATARVLAQADDAWTIASWLTTPKRSLGGAVPVESLRIGNAAAVELAAADYVRRST